MVTGVPDAIIITVFNESVNRTTGDSPQLSHYSLFLLMFNTLAIILFVAPAFCNSSIISS